LVERLANSFSPRNLALLTSLALVLFVVAKLGTKLVFVHPLVTPVWIPAGIAFAAFMLFGYRVWPAVFVGSFLSHIIALGPVNVSFGIPFAATLEGLLGSYFVHKYANGLKAFERAEDVFRFVSLACICAPAIGATLGIAVMGFSGRAHLGFIWGTWWLAHGIGILLVAPFLILLVSATRYPPTSRELAELTLLLVGLIFLCLLVFGPLSASLNRNQVIQAWLCIPFLTWAAFRFRPLEAAGTTLILFGSAIWGTLHGYGSFVAKSLRNCPAFS
jgi:integral membrane sensor domain MASE1